jgi:hypothetical protein
MRVNGNKSEWKKVMNKYKIMRRNKRMNEV